MKRRDFLGKIGLALGCVVGVPLLPAKEEKEINTSKYIAGCDPFDIHNRRKFPLTYSDCNIWEGALRIAKDDNNYRINDVFTDGRIEFIVVYSDSEYYYCYPSEGWYNFET